MAMQVNGKVVGTLLRAEDRSVIDTKVYNTKFWVREDADLMPQVHKLMRSRGFVGEQHGGWVIEYRFVPDGGNNG